MDYETRICKFCGPALLEDAKGELPHELTTGIAEGTTLTVQVVEAGGWTLSSPKTLSNGAWLYCGWKLKLTTDASGSAVTVNGAPVELTDGVGYYTCGMCCDVTVRTAKLFSISAAVIAVPVSEDISANNAAISDIGIDCENHVYTVTVTGDRDSMDTFEYNGMEGCWIGLDVGIGRDIVGVDWNGAALTSDDKDTAAANGLVENHIAVFADFDAMLAGQIVFTAEVSGYFPVTLKLTGALED